jgi:hypothetical protein
MKGKWAVAIIVALLLIQFFSYYRGVYLAPPSQGYKLEEISVPQIHPATFSDKYEVGEGVVVFDQDPFDRYSPSEITALLNRLTSRGFSYEFMKDRGELQEKLKYASSFVVISPGTPFEAGEIKEINRFLAKGGRLLLISDPQRADEMNSLSSEFGIIFEEGYLYNMKDHEGNFRNIFLDRFANTDVTKDLGRVVFYSSCSVTGPGGIIFGDENTLSSRKETSQGFSPAVLTGGILAICDLTFLTEPYNSLEDNPRLVSNMADFLTQGKRTFLLEDFPYFLDEEVNVAYTNVSLLDQAFKMKEILGRQVTIGAEEDATGDLVLLGLYGDFAEVSKYLDEANISILGQTLRVPGLGEIDTEGTTFIYLYEENDRKVLLILADTGTDLGNTLELVESRKFTDFLIDGKTAIVPSSKETEKEEEKVVEGTEEGEEA